MALSEPSLVEPVFVKPWKGQSFGDGHWETTESNRSINQLHAIIQQECKEKENPLRTRIGGGPSTKVNVTLLQWLRQFWREDFVVVTSCIFCACNAEVSPKKSIVTAHIAAQRHKRGTGQLCCKRQRQKAMRRSFANYQAEKGKDLWGLSLSKALPTDVSLRRVEVATAFLKGGVPFAKLPYLRGLLEDGHVRLTDAHHLS